MKDNYFQLVDIFGDKIIFCTHFCELIKIKLNLSNICIITNYLHKNYLLVI